MFKITESHKDKVDFVIMYLKTYLNLCNGSIFSFYAVFRNRNHSRIHNRNRINIHNLGGVGLRHLR